MGEYLIPYKLEEFTPDHSERQAPQSPLRKTLMAKKLQVNSQRKPNHPPKKESSRRDRSTAKDSGKRRSHRFPKLPKAAYKSRRGVMYRGTLEDFLASALGRRYRGKVNLVFTSPPFPLNHKKSYGNLQGEDYAAWLAALAPRLRDLLTPNGSVVMELGNAWEQGQPVMSPLALVSLLKFLEIGRFKLCQQFVCYNPARLPGPAQWVNVGAH